MKVIKIIVLIFVTSLSINAQTLNFNWGFATGSIGDDRVKDIAFDSNGNVVVVGNFSQTVNFNPDTSAQINLMSHGSTDFFIAKYSPNGTLIWAKNFGGTQAEDVKKVKLDNTGNIYISGTFYNTANFGTSSSANNLTSNGSSDIFLAKYDSVGNNIWAISFGGQMSDAANSFVVDEKGSSYIIGTFYNIVDFNPDTSVVENHSSTSNGADIFIEKIDANGHYIWSKQLGAIQGDFGFAIDYDKQGGIYCAGTYASTVDFNTGLDTNTLTSTGFATDVFFCKYDTAGNYIWAKSIGGTGSETVSDFKVDGFGNCYLAGGFVGVMNTDPNGGTNNLTNAATSTFNDIYFAKYNSLGMLQWANSIGGSNNDLPNSLEYDIDGNVLLSGKFKGQNIDFNPATADTNYLSSTTAQFDDAFIAKFNAQGNYLWAHNLGGIYNDEGTCLKIDNMNSIYYTGTVGSPNVSLNFLGQTPYYSTNGSADLFITKYAVCNINAQLSLSQGIISAATNTGASYQWYKCNNGVLAEISGASLNTFHPTLAGSYTVVITTLNGCSDTANCLNVNTCDLTNLNVTAAGTTLTAAQAGATYQWLNCNSNFEIISGQFFQTFTATQNGSYAVVISIAGCVDTSSCFAINNVGINELNENNTIAIFPNPAQQTITISFESEILSNLEIVDIVGQTIMSLDKNIYPKKYSKTFDISMLAKGVYFLKFGSENNFQFKKIVKN